MFLLYGILAAALFMDFYRCRIPNLLILAGYTAGLIYRICSCDIWYVFITDSIVVVLALYPLFLIGAFGGGDLKLFAVIGLFLGLDPTVNIFITALMAGAVCSVIKIFAAFLKRQNFTLSNLYIHFSLPVLIGTILTLHGGITWITF